MIDTLQEQLEQWRALHPMQPSAIERSCIYPKSHWNGANTMNTPNVSTGEGIEKP